MIYEVTKFLGEGVHDTYEVVGSDTEETDSEVLDRIAGEVSAGMLGDLILLPMGDDYVLVESECYTSRGVVQAGGILAVILVYPTPEQAVDRTFEPTRVPESCPGKVTERLATASNAALNVLAPGLLPDPLAVQERAGRILKDLSGMPYSSWGSVE